MDKILAMEDAGSFAASALDFIEPFLKPGITSLEINNKIHNFIIKNKGIPGALNYKGFPKSLCISINHEVCHGIPKNQIIKNGDIIKLDVVVKKNGYYGDTCRCYVIGENLEAEQLKNVTYEAMWEAIKIVKPGLYINEIGKIIEQYVKNFGYTCVRDFCGHGIGHKMHMEPSIPHFDTGLPGPMLIEGMTFTIEPMVNGGNYKIKILNDKWTVVTEDKSLSAQWEHTILVTNTGYKVLTLSLNEKELFKG